MLAKVASQKNQVASVTAAVAADKMQGKMFIDRGYREAPLLPAVVASVATENEKMPETSDSRGEGAVAAMVAEEQLLESLESREKNTAVAALLVFEVGSERSYSSEN